MPLIENHKAMFIVQIRRRCVANVIVIHMSKWSMLMVHGPAEVANDELRRLSSS